MTTLCIASINHIFVILYCNSHLFYHFIASYLELQSQPWGSVSETRLPSRFAFFWSSSSPSSVAPKPMLSEVRSNWKLIKPFILGEQCTCFDQNLRVHAEQACKLVDCGQGTCNSSVDVIPFFQCDCYPGWTQLKLLDKPILPPCIIPNCPFPDTVCIFAAKFAPHLFLACRFSWFQLWGVTATNHYLY